MTGSYRSQLAAAALGLALAGCAGSPPATAGPAAAATAEPSSPAPSLSAGPASAGPGSPAPETAVDLAALLADDPAVPLDLAEGRHVAFDHGVTLVDVTYASAHGGRVTAWLVLPPDGAADGAGMLYLHGSETDRDDLVDEAAAMATAGVAGLVIDAPFARPAPHTGPAIPAWFDPAAERDAQAATVADLRRGIDVLAAAGGVDPARTGFVGHSWGASTGAAFAAVDDRPVAFVLVTGRPSWTDAAAALGEDRLKGMRTLVGEEAWQAYLDTMAPLDAVRHAGSADPATLYLQFGALDDVVTTADQAAFVAAAPAGTRVDTYEAGHALDGAAVADRVAWLAGRLGVPPVADDVLAGVGLPDVPVLIPGS